MIVTLNEISARIAAEHPTEYVPLFCPRGGGASSRVLIVLTAPGPRVTESEGGSGFVSRYNSDPTARNLDKVLQLHLGGEPVVLWNAIPWFIGDRTTEPWTIRDWRVSDIEPGLLYLRDVMAAMHDLRFVVFCGGAAKDARRRLERRGMKPSGVEFAATYHTGDQSWNNPVQQKDILASFKQIAKSINELGQKS